MMQFGPQPEDVMWAREQLARYEYKPGWEFGIDVKGSSTFLTVKFMALDSRGTGQTIPIVGTFALRSVDFRGYSNIADEDAFFRDLHIAISTAERHEQDEWLRRDGKILNDPHK